MTKVLKRPAFWVSLCIFFPFTVVGLENKGLLNSPIAIILAMLVALLLSLFFTIVIPHEDRKEHEKKVEWRRKRYDFVYKLVCVYALREHHDYDTYWVDSVFPNYEGEGDEYMGWKDYQGELVQIARCRSESILIRASAARLLFSCYEFPFGVDMMRVMLDDNPEIRDAVARGWFFLEEKTAKDEYGSFYGPSKFWKEYVASCFDEEHAERLLAFAGCEDEADDFSIYEDDNLESPETDKVWYDKYQVDSPEL